MPNVSSMACTTVRRYCCTKASGRKALTRSVSSTVLLSLSPTWQMRERNQNNFMFAEKDQRTPRTDPRTAGLGKWNRKKETQHCGHRTQSAHLDQGASLRLTPWLGGYTHWVRSRAPGGRPRHGHEPESESATPLWARCAPTGGQRHPTIKRPSERFKNHSEAQGLLLFVNIKDMWQSHRSENRMSARNVVARAYGGMMTPPEAGTIRNCEST